MSRIRTCNDHFDVKDMCLALEPYAKLKVVDWDWDLSYYSKTRRSQGPDHAGLARYVKLLAVLQEFLPNACPLPLQIKEVWLYLHRRFRIMCPDKINAGKSVDSWATEVGNLVGVMFSHLRSYRTSTTTFLNPEVAELVNKIPMPSSSSSTESSLGAQKRVLALPVETKKIAKHDSDSSSVKICSVSCKCPLCCPPDQPQELGSDVSEDEKSETSQAAADNSQVAVLKRFQKKPAAAKKKPSADVEVSPADGTPPAVQVVRRLKAGKECTYIMQNKKYLVGRSKKQRADHDNIIHLLAEQIAVSDGPWSKDEANEFLDNH